MDPFCPASPEEQSLWPVQTPCAKSTPGAPAGAVLGVSTAPGAPCPGDGMAETQPLWAEPGGHGRLGKAVWLGQQAGLFPQEKQKLLDEMEELSLRLSDEQENRRKLGDRLSHERHQFQRDKEATQEVSLAPGRGGTCVPAWGPCLCPPHPETCSWRPCGAGREVVFGKRGWHCPPTRTWHSD